MDIFEIDREEEWVLENLYRENYKNLSATENRRTPHALYGQKGSRAIADHILGKDEWNPLKDMRDEKVFKKNRQDWSTHHIVAEIIYAERGYHSR